MLCGYSAGSGTPQSGILDHRNVRGALGRFLEAYSVRRVRAAIRARSITENQSCERDDDFSTAEADRPFWQRLLVLLERNEDFRPGVSFFCVSDGTGRFSQRIASVDRRG
jgi:hypothetical protein